MSAAALAAAAATLLLAAPALGQAGGAVPSDSGAVSPDSADRIRAALERPPGDHPFDLLDAVALPFRVATFPLTLAGRGIAAGLDLLAAGGPPPFYLRALEDVRQWGLRPDVGSLGPRSGPALSLAFVRYEPFYARSGVSLRGSQDHRAGFRWSGAGTSADVGFAFHRDAEPRFWGVGPGTPSSLRTSFRHDRIDAYLDGAWRPAERLTLHAGAGYEENRVGGGGDDASPDIGEVFAPDSLFGLGEETRFFRASTGFELDLTDRVGFQRRGVAFGGSGALYRGAGPTESDFHRLRARAHAFLPLNPRQLLALGGAVETNRGDDGPGVPFTHLATLGDGVGGRAYQDGRFRDRDLLALTAEWRYEVWRELQSRLRAEGFVFFEEGAVTGDLGSLDSSDFHPSWGAGLRVVGRDGVLGRAFVADGDEGARFQVEGSAAFP